ncbi:MAG: hypothetical protein HYU55_14870 [Nocardioides sp.]|nr:hypothetical protein [Nocardioides sp.]
MRERWAKLRRRGGIAAAGVVLGLTASAGAATVAAESAVTPDSVSVQQLSDSSSSMLAAAGSLEVGRISDEYHAEFATATELVEQEGWQDWLGATALVGSFYGGLALLALVLSSTFRTEQMRRWALVAVGGSLAAIAVWLLARVLLRQVPGLDGRRHDVLAMLVGSLWWAQVLLTALAIGVFAAGLCSLLLPRRIRAVLRTVDVPLSEKNPLRLTLAGGPTYGLGLAFSGGGVRAASMTLGALQVLDDADLGWDSASRVTAVSGGSYMAGGWSLARAYESSETQVAGLPKPWANAMGHQPGPEEQHLMANLGYLLANSPRGVAEGDEGDADAAQRARRAARFPTAFATVITGMIVNGTVLFAMLWVITQPWGWLYRSYYGGMCDWSDGELTYASGHECMRAAAAWTPGLTFFALGVVFIVSWVVVAKLLELRGQDAPAWVVGIKYAAYGSTALGVCLLLILGAVPVLITLLWKPHLLQANILAVLGALGSASAVVRMLKRPLARFAPIVGGALFAALLVFVACRCVLFALKHGTQWPTLLVPLAVLVLVQVFTSPEWWSLAAFYRGKLRLAFATYRINNGRVATAYADGNSRPGDRLPEPSLATLHTRDQDPDHGTPLTVCTTATVSGRKIRTHHGIPAMSVTFDPREVAVHFPSGEPGLFRRYAVGTETLQALMARRAPRITTMLSVGLSGAAVSPAMGRFRVGPVSMLLTFANIRLGMWIPNPRYAPAIAEHGLRLPQPRLGYLLKEFFGFHDPSDLYLYITDGGHWENTGLVELLRTNNCREVVCIDADAGPGNLASSISKAIDLAWLECGCHISMDLDSLRSDVVVSPGRDYSPRSVNLGLVLREDRDDVSISVLWYAKPALTREMPLRLLSYREVDRSFPRVTTLNQFFHLAQYTAYRDLGRYNARQLVDARQALKKAVEDAPDLSTLAARSSSNWAIGELVRLIQDTAARTDLSENETYELVRTVYAPASTA